VTILNNGGTQTVCKDEEFATQKDGSLILQWNYGDMKTGYEIWSMQGNELTIQRWNSKEEKDGGRVARRIGLLPASNLRSANRYRTHVIVPSSSLRPAAQSATKIFLFATHRIALLSLRPVS